MERKKKWEDRDERNREGKERGREMDGMKGKVGINPRYEILALPLPRDLLYSVTSTYNKIR